MSFYGRLEGEGFEIGEGLEIGEGCRANEKLEVGEGFAAAAEKSIYATLGSFKWFIGEGWLSYFLVSGVFQDVCGLYFYLII